MRAPILLSALGALTLCMSDARSQEPEADGADAAKGVEPGHGSIASDPKVWTTVGARVPAISLPAIVGTFGYTPKGGLVDPGTRRFEPRDLYNVLRTVDDDPAARNVTKRTLLIQFASW